MGRNLQDLEGPRPAVGKRPRPYLAFIRPFTTRVVNPVTRRFAAWLPLFAILSYRGRRSGKRYRIPMNAFRDGDDWVFALTYGSEVQWVKNVMAAGEAELRKRRTTIRLVEPELFVDPGRRATPLGVRQLLGLMRVSEFLRMRPAPGHPDALPFDG